MPVGVTANRGGARGTERTLIPVRPAPYEIDIEQRSPGTSRNTMIPRVPQRVSQRSAVSSPSELASASTGPRPSARAIQKQTAAAESLSCAPSATHPTPHRKPAHSAKATRMAGTGAATACTSIKKSEATGAQTAMGAQIVTDRHTVPSGEDDHCAADLGAEAVVETVDERTERRYPEQHGDLRQSDCPRSEIEARLRQGRCESFDSSAGSDATRTG